MAVRERPKGSGHYMYDFRISGRRYRGSIPEARTKAQAKQAEAAAEKKDAAEREAAPAAEAEAAQPK